MAKVCFLLAVFCGLAVAEPSTMYPAAPAKYPAAPATYPAPAPAKYEAPAPAKYEEKKDEYPMKPEYKTEMKPEYKTEEKMEYGGMKYRRSAFMDDDEEEEELHSDAYRPFRLSRKEIQAVRDAVIREILSESDPGFRKGFAKEGAGVLGSLIGSRIRGDPFSTVDDAGRGKFFGKLGANLAGGLLGGLLGDERACWSLGITRKQAKLIRDVVLMEAENDPRFGKSFGKAFAKEGAGVLGTFIGSKIRGGDPARGRGKFAGKLAGSLAAGALGGLLGNDDELSMEEMEEMMDAMPTKGRWMW